MREKTRHKELLLFRYINYWLVVFSLKLFSIIIITHTFPSTIHIFVHLFISFTSHQIIPHFLPCSNEILCDKIDKLTRWNNNYSNSIFFFTSLCHKKHTILVENRQNSKRNKCFLCKNWNSMQCLPSSIILLRDIQFARTFHVASGTPCIP